MNLQEEASKNIIEDDEFDMELDDELDNRIMSAEEIGRLNSLVLKIENNISKKTRTQDRYGDRMNRKKYHQEKVKWVENHVKLVKQKLAGYHNYLDHQLFGLIFDPDELLLQLRLRADVEFIDGKRSLIVKISEQDVAPTMPAVLYISSKQPLRLSDGWYEINCTGDSLMEKRLENLSIGSKVLVCGATLSKSVQAAHPLESISEINISANSTKRVKWHTKLGIFFKNVPPSTLSSVSSAGKNIFKLKLKIVRKYPDIWIQDNPAKEKRRAIFSKRQRDRWHAQKDKNMDLQREKLAATIKKKHRDDLDEELANLTLKEIAELDDPEDIYTAVTLSKDPEDTVSNLTEEQRKKYQKFAEKQNFKINETFRREHQQNAATTSKKLRFKVKEGNRQSILQISENKLPENLRPGSVVIVECANITYGGKITLQKHSQIRAIEQETPRAELPTDIANILPELAATVTEVDLVGIVVDLTPYSCVLADNKKQYVNIQLSNTWSFEALDKIVIVGAVLAFKNLEIDRKKPHHVRFTSVSEVLSQVSDFNGSRGALYNLFNALCKVFIRTGHESAIAAYRSSANASLTTSPARSSSSTPSRTPGNQNRMVKLEMSEDKWSRSNFSFNQK
ncbi:unnamed protein product [Oikopleura dioica]|uniref:Tower domain-containing protein n=1 Tax=Oikopleura dioica TaxID=34765 RepID=E4WYR2_OIKDI|nr:unnamed protein product [Oikopleura dioica]